MIAAGTGIVLADPEPIAVPAVIQRNYDEARQRYQTNSASNDIALQFSRACYDRAEFSKDNHERASLAEEGIDAARAVINRAPGLAAGHYYLGMNLAQLARTKMLGALAIVREMEKEWLATLALDPKLDYAGADRNLGLLYRDAPGRPISIGSSVKARRHLIQAVNLAPNFPENRLNLIETWLMWRKNTLAQNEYDKLRQQLPEAHKEFKGDYWEPSWRDWDERIEKIVTSLNEPPPASTVHRR